MTFETILKMDYKGKTFEVYWIFYVYFLLKKTRYLICVFAESLFLTKKSLIFLLVDEKLCWNIDVTNKHNEILFINIIIK